MTLPIHAHLQTLLPLLQAHLLLLVTSPTASGKTTQIPQICAQIQIQARKKGGGGAGNNGCIAITQPRRIAAIEGAKRVKEEWKEQTRKRQMEKGEQKEEEGKEENEVAYAVRFEDTSTTDTKIKFVTDGYLLREILNDNNIQKYSTIILDEVHERSVATDTLLALLKRAFLKRKHSKRPLQLIIMSATIANPDKYTNYFLPETLHHFDIPVRKFKIQEYHSTHKIQDIPDAVVRTILQLHKQKPLPNDILRKRGDILVFLVGEEQIETTKNILSLLIPQFTNDYPPLLVTTLYSSMPQHKQQAAIQRAPLGVRKVILSTNIAETSLTLPAISYIIDSGYYKKRIFHAGTYVSSLVTQPISKMQHTQRAGRAGREADGGECYCLWPESNNDAMKTDVTPEIMDVDLGPTILTLKAANMLDPFGMDWLDQPPKPSVISATNQLIQLNALTSADSFLTPLGKKMAMLPLQPTFSHLLLGSASTGCVQEILFLVGSMSSNGIFSNKAANERSSDGDHIEQIIAIVRFLKAFPGAMKVNKPIQQWAQDAGVNAKNLIESTKIANQIRDMLPNAPTFSSLATSGALNDVDNATKWEPVLKTLCQTFRQYAFRSNSQRFTLYGRKAKDREPLKADLWPGSVLFGRPYRHVGPPNTLHEEWVVFEELLDSGGKLYLRGVDFVKTDWLCLDSTLVYDNVPVQPKVVPVKQVPAQQPREVQKPKMIISSIRQNAMID